MSYNQPVRRRRKRRGLVAAIVVLVTAGAIAGVVWFRNEQQRLTDYLVVARQVAQTYDQVAMDVGSVVSDLDDLERPMLLDRLANSSTAAADADVELTGADPPPKAGAVNGYAVVASNSWSEGVTLMEEAVLVLLDEPDDPEAVAKLGEAFLDLEIGDRAYRGMLAELELLGEDEVSRPFPEVSFVSAEARPLYDARLMADRIEQLVMSLSTRFDVAVSSVRYDPEPAGDNEGVPVIPFTETFGLQVTITNRGNEPAANVLVNVFFVQAEEGSASDPLQLSQSIPSLAAGDSTVVSFDDIPIAVGAFHEMVVRAELAEDEDPESNEYREVIFRNASR